MKDFIYIDSQRTKLYRAEREAFADSNFEGLMTEDGARVLIAEVWARAIGNTDHPSFRVSNRVRSGAAWYFGSRHEILFPQRIVQWVVIHELTHSLRPGGASHGPEFAHLYLEVVERTFGFKMRERLGAAFRKHRVKSHGKSKLTEKGISPKRETKRQKADKMAAAAGWIIFADDWNRHWYYIRNDSGQSITDCYGLDEVIRYIRKEAA